MRSAHAAKPPVQAEDEDTSSPTSGGTDWPGDGVGAAGLELNVAVLAVLKVTGLKLTALEVTAAAGLVGQAPLVDPPTCPQRSNWPRSMSWPRSARRRTSAGGAGAVELPAAELPGIGQAPLVGPGAAGLPRWPASCR
jgi:hypothetical protein